MHTPLVFSAALLAFSAAPAPTDAIVSQETLDVRYFDGPGAQTLDVFAPKGAANRPVVLFIHGGAWMSGDKNFFGLYRSVGRFFARHGAVAVCVNYRLSPRVQHPEHVKDVARAFAWVRAHAADYGGDSDRILLCGHSAGGHIVSLLAADENYLNNPDLKLTAEDRVAIKGVMAVSGVYRIPTPEEFAVMMGDMVNGLLQSTGNKMIAPATLAPIVLGPSRALNPFRLVFGDGRAAAAKASPLSHVRKGLPPFLVLYAGRELPMLDGMAVEFGKALEDAGDAVEVRRIDGCTHNNILFKLNQENDPAAAALLAFLGKFGGPATGVKP
jgi:acetyl esterase/lipase